METGRRGGTDRRREREGRIKGDRRARMRMGRKGILGRDGWGGDGERARERGERRGWKERWRAREKEQ
jgi:hypothetical protein